MQIGPWSPDKSVLLVAEIGNNHEGDPDAAHRLVEQAAAAGANAVKFQTFATDRYAGPGDRARRSMLARFELAPETFAELAADARQRGLLFLSTPLDLGSVVALRGIVDAYKVASGDITFLPLIERIAAAGKPVVLSTGASTEEPIAAALARLDAVAPNAERALLHCVSAYPAPIEEANLAAIGWLRRRFGCVVGYSDHTLGNEACTLAVAAGARIVEKHFTLAHDYSEFRDHRLSATPEQMAELASAVRRLERIVGPEQKAVQRSEEGAAHKLRRSVAAGRALPAGHRLAPEDLEYYRPADGLPPGSEGPLLGRPLARPVEPGHFLRPEDLA